jgi:ubiquinone/menaquinone biosynthesis C-methylase UbiE
MGELLAAMYDPLVAPMDPMGMRKWREWTVRAARGRTLELGVGTGLNLPYYRAVKAVAAIDPDGASLRRAWSRRDGHGESITKVTSVTLYQARAEELPFADESFDAVVGTLTFCTIGDPARALAEARRVLKPGGALRLAEHVRVENRWVASAQDLVTPLWKEIAGGCHLNRDTRAAVVRAGFRVCAAHRHIGGLFIGIDAVK